MNTPPIPRWRLGFIAWRWRYLFAAVVSLVTLIGGLHEWQRYEHGKEAYIVLKVDNAVLSPAMWRELISDDLLREASRASGFPPRRRIDSVESLRRTIRFEISRDGSLVSISLKGRNELTKAIFCNEVGELVLKRAYQRLQDACEANDRWKASAVIAIYRKDLQEARDHLEKLRKTRIDSEIPTELEQAALLAAEADVNARTDELTAALSYRNASSSFCYRCPLSFHRRAFAPMPAKTADLYQPLTRWSLWITAGLLIAGGLIYLAEGFVPRPSSP